MSRPPLFAIIVGVLSLLLFGSAIPIAAQAGTTVQDDFNDGVLAPEWMVLNDIDTSFSLDETAGSLKMFHSGGGPGGLGFPRSGVRRNLSSSSEFLVSARITGDFSASGAQRAHLRVEDESGQGFTVQIGSDFGSPFNSSICRLGGCTSVVYGSYTSGDSVEFEIEKTGSLTRVRMDGIQILEETSPIGDIVTSELSISVDFASAFEASFDDFSAGIVGVSAPPSVPSVGVLGLVFGALALASGIFRYSRLARNVRRNSSSEDSG